MNRLKRRFILSLINRLVYVAANNVTTYYYVKHMIIYITISLFILTFVTNVNRNWEYFILRMINIYVKLQTNLTYMLIYTNFIIKRTLT